MPSKHSAYDEARRRCAHPHVCPYCSTPYATRDKLVDHLTRLPGCLLRRAQGTTRDTAPLLWYGERAVEDVPLPGDDA